MASDDQHDSDGACCAPVRPTGEAPGDSSSTPPSADAGPSPGVGPEIDFVDLEGGEFLIGSSDPGGFPGDGEGPVRPVAVSPFRIARHAVTNAEFAEFVAATGHTTEAEAFGWSFVFHLFLPDDFEPTRAVAQAPWWRQVYGADWAHPAGPQSDVEGLDDHPVAHVSWNDATAYAAWAGARLPTEAEWEFAARGGLEQKRYPWGDEFAPGDTTMCNIFEGTFPTENTGADGWIGTAPVDTFPPNGYGLHNVAGNVWEWCHDWFHANDHRSHMTADEPTHDPSGPATGESKVMRGGSYLCHDSYCNRYRVAARNSNTPDSSTGNLGFRLAADAAAPTAVDLAAS